MKTCVFAGTFDPFTVGHAFVVEKCLELFDKVVIAVGVNKDKKPLFTENERIELIKAAYLNDARVQVFSYQGMLVDFMKAHDIKYTVRGVRTEDDYKYESTMARYNQDMYPDCTTVYIQTPSNLMHVSSSAMRNILSLNSDISAYVPENCLPLIEKFIREKQN